jgi:hypothetical protein
MRHTFADRYQTDDGPRIRCSRCGVGSHWPGAADWCSGPAPTIPVERAAPAPRARDGRAARRDAASRVHEEMAEAWAKLKRSNLNRYRQQRTKEPT